MTALPAPLRPLLPLAALLLVAGAAAAEPERYAFDPVHTRVLVAVEHAGFSQALGTLSGASGEIRLTPADDGLDWRDAQVEVRLPLARLDFGDAEWNRAVLASGLLDAGRHPEARFVSTSVEPQDVRTARVCGELSLRGVTRPLCMDVRFNALRRHPLPPFRRTAGFSATATLDRREFGITAWPTVIGTTVELRIEAEAVRARTVEATAPEDTP